MCIFCKIIQTQIPAESIYEDNNAVAILDVHPRSPGHTMILPKAHAENILDLPEDKINGVFQAVKKVTELLKQTLEPDGFTIGINHGKVSGQTVEHLHIHIMPRWNDDAGGSVHDVVDKPSKEPLEKLAAKIRSTKQI